MFFFSRTKGQHDEGHISELRWPIQFLNNVVILPSGFSKLVNMHWLQIMCIVFQKLTRSDLQPILLYINVQCVLFLFSTMIRLICYCFSSSINLTAMCVQIDDEWQWQIGIALPRHTLKCARNIMVEEYMPHNKSMRKSKMEMRPEDKNGFK